MSSLPADSGSTDQPLRPTYSPTTAQQGTTVADPVTVTVEDLNPPYVSRAVLSVVGADIGLGLSNIEKGLFVTFERWFNLSVGDIYEFYMGGHLLAWDEILPGQQGEALYQLSIAFGRVPTGFIYPCYGRVLRAGGMESTSVPQTYFIKETRPGGEDTDPGKQYHSELKLHLPADLQGPGAVLEPDRASQGVLITIERYPNIRVRDFIEMELNKRIVTLELDSDHVDGRKPIEVFLSEEVISRAGSGLAAIRFLVRDEVRNFSGPIQQWSQTVYLSVDLDPNLLERPYFIVDGVDTTDVNFDTQGGGRFQVEVVTPTGLPDGNETPAGTQIRVTLAGILADGSSLVRPLRLFPAIIGRSAFTNVDNSFIKELINGSIQVSYELLHPLDPVIGTSRAVTVTVFGTQSNMPAVMIVETESGLIDPTLAQIRVNFPEYTPYDANYPVTLRFEVVLPGGGVVFYEQTVLAGEPPPPTRFRIVRQSDFQRFVGLGLVRVFYRVDDGKIGPLDINPLTVRDSEDLYVQFGDRVETMPKPLVQGVDLEGNLDPNDVIGQAIVTLPYVNTHVGETFVWRWLGSNPGGTTGDEILLNSATAGAAVAFPVDKAFVEANLDGEIRLSYSLERPGQVTLRSEVLVIFVGRPIGDLLRPEVREASRAPDQLIPERVTAGATIVVYFPQMRPSDRIRAVWTGIPGIGTHSETKDGNDARTVEFRVPPAVVGANITATGRDITVQYFLIRGAREIPSPLLTLRLLPLTTLPIPTIEGVGDNPVLATFRLTGAERTVVKRWHFIHSDQRMWMDYEGVYADGRLYREATYTSNLVTADGETNGIMPPTPVEELRLLKDGSRLTIRFWVSFDRSQFKSEAVLFRERHYLIQTLPSVLPHPFINGASNTGPSVTVEPLAIQNNVQVTVRYDGMRGDDLIMLKWIYHDATFHSVTLSGLDGGTRVFNIANSILARSVNTTVQLSYSVVRTGVPGAIPSEVQTVRVNTILQGGLPRPLINEVPHNGTLNVPGLPTWALLTVESWPLQYSGMLVWLALRCTGANPNPFVIWSGHSHNFVSGVAIPAPLDWLATCPNGERLSIEFKVAYLENATEAEAITFPVTEYNVVNAVPVLTISRLLDDLGTSIADGGYAATSTVTLSGTATPTPRSAFDIYDGELLIRSVPGGTSSAWNVVLTGVPLGLHRYTARGTSGIPRPVSNLWSFTNLAVVTPTITVRDSRGEVAQNGTTTDTTVTYSGKATPRLQVQLYENGPGPIVDVDPNGNWSYVRTGLTPRTYTVSVKALYANVESTTRTFTVGVATLPLVINQATMNLNGYAIVAAGWTRNGQNYPGNAQTRTPTGGVLPYTYSSRNPALASVTQGGTVTGNQNGNTTIDVRDDAGSTVSYSVSVSNVWNLRERRSMSNHHGSILWRNSLPGAVGMSAGALNHMQTVYGPSSGFPFPPNDGHWCCLDGGCSGFLPEGIMYYSDGRGFHCRWNVYDYWAFCLQP